MGAAVGLTGSVGPHFAAHEFACPHCHVAIVRPSLVTRLEALRSTLRKPIPIVSGYRCPVHNPASGGATNSQHMYGAAADLPSGLVPVELAERMFVGVGHKGGWAIHVDVRDGPKASWAY